MLKKKFLVIVVLGLLLVGFVDNFVLASGPPPSNVNIQVDTSLANSSKIKGVSRVTFTVVITCIFGFMLYVIPMFIALKRKHPQRFPIGCLNIFLGWTFIGWVICLVWASSNQEPIIVEKDSSSNKYDDLEKLQKLKANGTLSEEEFEIEKQKILR